MGQYWNLQEIGFMIFTIVLRQNLGFYRLIGICQEKCPARRCYIKNNTQPRWAVCAYLLKSQRLIRISRFCAVGVR